MTFASWRTRAPLATALALASVALCGPRLAHAEPAARLVYLRGRGTETCPSEAEVREAVQTRLGYDPFSTYAPSTMFAEVAAASGGFTASLKLVDGDNAVRGDRELKVRGRCSELMDAIALTISIAIDPMSVTRAGPPDGTPPKERLVDTTLGANEVPERTEPAAPAEDRRQPVAPAPPLVASVGLGPLASLGTAPALSFGGVLTIDAQKGRWLGGLEGRADLPSSSAGTLGGVQSSLLAGSVFAGVREGPLFACAVFAMGRLAATATDTAQARAQDALFLAAGFRIGAAIELTDRIEARLRGEILANLDRHDLQISEQSVYAYPAASGNVSAAIAVRFR